ncbi:hypothetical protein Leryth_017409 [Lithospermum erythrorhizon]|nr:hypothetical protein Leryth_017409 [Lithospermum erythrorhizon]
MNMNMNMKKKAKPMEAVAAMATVKMKESVSVVAEDPNAVSCFRISKALREALKKKGIESLFPIQAMTFNAVLDGSDLVGRARTGQGKTLAFVLPILESITNGPAKESRKTGYGRAPSVLVLLPTRELATQVFADFQYYGGSVGLSSCCLYGGAPYQPQYTQLKRGVDIIIGTPGRIKDHIERGNIDFTSLKFRVLDEADEMLRMGFVDDVELILGKVEDARKVQTLLFSATLPDWVKQTLLGMRRLRLKLLTHAIPFGRRFVFNSASLILSSGGQTIIFTETKDSASGLAGLLYGARALHGDIQQATREVTLKGFRSGKFTILVATNVAARGLDIDNVQLIIQCEPPRDVDAYIHRSGRTGRAGNTGVAVMLYDPKRANVTKIERESGVKFEHLSAPQPADIAKAAGRDAAEMISRISDSVIPAFKSAAEELMHTSVLSPAELLAKALAKAVGYTEIKRRSLLSSLENHVTVLLECGRPIYAPSLTVSFLDMADLLYGALRRFLPEEKVESIQGLSLTDDGKGAVFDVSNDDLDMFLAAQGNAGGVTLKVVDTLPRLQDRDQARNSRPWGNGRGIFSDRRDGRFSGGRGRGDSSRFPRDGGHNRFSRDGGNNMLSRDGGNSRFSRDDGNNRFSRDGGNNIFPREGGSNGFSRDGGNNGFPRDGGNNGFPRDGGKNRFSRGGGNSRFSRDGGTGQGRGGRW